MASLDHADRIARTQHGLVVMQQLYECGLTRRQVQGLVGHGALIRMRRGIYRMSGSPVTWEQALLAATLSAGPRAVASHSSAARLWNFRYLPEDGFELTTPRAFETTAAGVHVHRSSLLSEGDVTTRSLIRCTTFERTLCDLTTQLSWLQLGRVLDDGLRSGDTTVKKLYDVVARLDSGPYRRLTVVQGLLAQRDADYDPGGSNAERRLVELVTNAGFPPPVQQYQVRVGGRRYFLDLAWPEHRVFVEWYGLPWHVGASRVAYDNARVSELSAVGWRPLIFTDESSRDDIIRQVRDLLDLVRSEQQRRGA